MIKAFRSCRPLRREAGFTLIEMLVVVAIMGFALTMIVTRGPVRSQALEMKAAVSEVAQGLRLARSRAIATNTPVQFAVDVPLRSFRIDRGTPTVLPRSLSIAMTAVSEETLGARLAAIRFNGDGSATGGRIELTDGQRRSQVGVDWLTGRVSVLQVR
ncbi:MAG: GspH/FimT family pseudopilin [Acetobacteraceae bacterium]|jgi:general secretion pathway protein H